MSSALLTTRTWGYLFVLCQGRLACWNRNAMRAWIPDDFGLYATFASHVNSMVNLSQNFAAMQCHRIWCFPFLQWRGWGRGGTALKNIHTHNRYDVQRKCHHHDPSLDRDGRWYARTLHPPPFAIGSCHKLRRGRQQVLWDAVVSGNVHGHTTIASLSLFFARLIVITANAFSNDTVSSYLFELLHFVK